ncbi:MAG TPA: hypothetical protein ENN38_05595 [Actinobacteria bacterium]|nr:hypothetical protein [Actinomycetota bacterium]
MRMDLLKKIKSFKIKNLFKLDRKALVISILGMVILVTSPVLADEVIHYGRIHHGVEINNIPIGHLTPSEAEKKVSETLNSVLDKPVIIQYEDKKWELMPFEIETKINASKSIERAYEVGRRGSFGYRLKIRFLSWFHSVDSPLIFYTNSKLLNKFIDDVAAEVDIDSQDASLKIDGIDVEVIKNQVGMKVKKTDLFSKIRDAVISFKNRTFDLPMTILPATITEEGIKKAQKDVVSMLKSSLFLKYSDLLWEIEPEKIGELVAFSKVEKSIEGKTKFFLEATLDKKKTEAYIKELTKDIGNEAQDAKFEVSGAKVKIIPSIDGSEIDTAAAFRETEKVIKNNFPREVILKTRTVAPDLTTEEAQAMGIKERVSVFTTRYSPSNIPRVNNIHLLAKALEGVMVAPGEVFSFNEAVGPRTAKKGYMEAPTIVNGELVSTVGGGVCQVGTTIFNTAFFGGYPIVKRSNHSFYISKYPTGRDATVSYGGADFKFRNDTSAHILIKTYYTSSSVSVSFYSTDFGVKVSYKTSQFTNAKPYSIEYVDDPTLLVGEQVVEEQGINGFDVTVYRTITRNGEIIKKDKFFSHYKPKKSVVRVGTKKEELEETVPEKHEEVTPTI